MRKVVTAADVVTVAPGGELEVDADALITPLARDEAAVRAITLKLRAVKGADTKASNSKRIVMASDQAGLALKTELKKFLAAEGFSIRDLGVHTPVGGEATDQTIAAAEAISRGQAECGIVIDASGIGLAIAANKVPHIRAAVCHDQASARASREFDDANVLALGSRWLTIEAARELVWLWLNTPFAGAHKPKLDRLAALEQRYLHR
jgi:ribose 5-phosphate isomerase B